MAWVAFDRAVRKAGALRHRTGPVDRWRELRDRIHREVCERGFDAGARHVHPVLRLARARRRDADDPARRLPAARRPARDRHGRGDPARAHARRLRAALRHRARRTTACRPARARSCPARSGWPTACADRPPRRGARAVRAAAGLANDVGLLAEEYDPRLGRQVGNFPQAFTHVGLVNTAMNLDRARPSPAEDRAEREGVAEMRAITLDPGVRTPPTWRSCPSRSRRRARSSSTASRSGSAARTRRSSAATTARRPRAPSG